VDDVAGGSCWRYRPLSCLPYKQLKRREAMDDFEQYYSKEELEKAKNRPRFKVGDMVTFLKEGLHYKTFKVIHPDVENGPYKVLHVCEVDIADVFTLGSTGHTQHITIKFGDELQVFSGQFFCKE
jgi:hypothetical protein